MPKNVCVEAMAKWNMSDTPLGEKCEKRFGSIRCEESYRYRSYDGSCNNLEHPSWGLSSTAYGRVLPAEYLDGQFRSHFPDFEKVRKIDFVSFRPGISEPRRSVSRKPLPSSRFVSSVLIPDMDKPERERTLALVQWTQFIGDDLFHTPVAKMSTFRFSNSGFRLPID